MTKEEARQILIEYTNMDKDVDSEYLQAIKVAISSLENNYNSAEINDNDLISKQEILDSLSYYELEDVIDEQDFGYNHAIQTIRDDVMTMKTYSAKEDTAELYWLQYDANPRIGNWHCTKCNMIVSENNPNYCPNCGAKMKGDTE